MDAGSVKNLVENLIPFVKKTGVQARSLEPRAVTLALPHDASNLNPMGMAAALCVMSFDVGKVSFIGKQVDIRFRRPGKGELVSKAALSEGDVTAAMAKAVEAGKHDVPITVEVTDTAGEPVATATVTMALRKLG
jgi:acyl-coenzyme A thioesterase PaaI-like protein